MNTTTTTESALQAHGIRLERVTGTIGAIVHGVDVNTPQEAEVATLLHRSLHEHGVLFLKSDTDVSKESFERFATVFGEPYVYPFGTGAGQLVTEEGSDSARLQTNLWHTDGSPQENPPQAALLCAIQVPSAGGDTMWSSMTAAFDALSSRYQRMLEGLEALHTTTSVAKAHKDGGRAFGEGLSAVHPVVITDPITKRKALFVNSVYTERILGMSDWESASLLRMLYEHVNTPEFHVRLRWQPNTVAVWEERVTQHRALADYNERRVLQRITTVGDKPA